MARILLVSNAVARGAERVTPSLARLPHQLRVAPASSLSLAESPQHDLVILDGRRNMIHAELLARLFRSSGHVQPLLLLLTQQELARVPSDLGVSSIVLDTAGTVELDARIRLLTGRGPRHAPPQPWGISIDDATHSVSLDRVEVALTPTEFRLLRYLIQHPGQAVTRERLLAEVWGPECRSRHRVVDLYVRRIREKLGFSQGAPIVTIPKVGYRFAGPAAAVGGSARST